MPAADATTPGPIERRAHEVAHEAVTRIFPSAILVGLARIRQRNNHPSEHYGSTEAINDLLDVLGAAPYDPSEHAPIPITAAAPPPPPAA